MKQLSALLLATMLSAPGHAKPFSVPAEHNIPVGAYTLDRSHASLLFSVDHLGFSNYNMRFTDFDVALHFNPFDVEKSYGTVTINANSLTLDNAPPGFKEELLGKNWINAAKHPKIIFRTTKVEIASKSSALVHGNLTLNGVTKPVQLNVIYNGGYAGHPMDPGPRIGVSGTTEFKRSDFGVSAGIPPKGSKMGVGDDVGVEFELELKGK
jgi:polyisoprenoid-binding protein YceI